MYAVAASTRPAATAFWRRSASANKGIVNAATRSKWPSKWTAMYGDSPNTTAARIDARACRVVDHASAYIDARFRNTYAIRRMFWAATGLAAFRTVAATNAGSAVCGWSTIVVPNGWNR